MNKNKKKVDIVLPVYNEEKILEKNIKILYDYLSKDGQFTWNIIIADNFSTDKTSDIGRSLALQNSNIKYKRFSVKGRGYALRSVFLESISDIICYMDLDLAVDLYYLKILIENIENGYIAAIGSKLIRGAIVKRPLYRKIISRVYSTLVKLLFFNKFIDTQCGFKAFKTDVIKKIIPLVKNNNWFFDTELLLLLNINNYSISEIPVRCVDYTDSKVYIIGTIIENIRELLRLRVTIHKYIIKTVSTKIS